MIGGRPGRWALGAFLTLVSCGGSSQHPGSGIGTGGVAGSVAGAGGTAAGSGAGTGGAAGTGAAGHYVTTLPYATNNKFDILFMIDSSSEMDIAQSTLIKGLPAFMYVLKGLPSGLPDLHIAVVTADLGAGDGSITGCSANGDEGVFRASPTGACTSTTLQPGATFISDSGGSSPATNFSGPDITTVLQCIAQVGQSGCGFEHQLASVVRALGADGSAPPPQNAGFLRPDAYLAIVMLTNEDDCSAPVNSALYDTALSRTSRLAGRPGRKLPLQRIRASLLARRWPQGAAVEVIAGSAELADGGALRRLRLRGRHGNADARRHVRFGDQEPQIGSRQPNTGGIHPGTDDAIRRALGHATQYRHRAVADNRTFLRRWAWRRLRRPGRADAAVRRELWQCAPLSDLFLKSEPNLADHRPSHRRHAPQSVVHSGPGGDEKPDRRHFPTGLHRHRDQRGDWRSGPKDCGSELRNRTYRPLLATRERRLVLSDPGAQIGPGEHSGGKRADRRAVHGRLSALHGRRHRSVLSLSSTRSVGCLGTRKGRRSRRVPRHPEGRRSEATPL